MSGHHWLIAELAAAVLAGVISHELAHWLVWALAGRRPRLDLRALDVEPRAGPVAMTRIDRLAAAAPYALGAIAMAIGLLAGELAVVAFALGTWVYVSREDLWTMRGLGQWRVTLQWQHWSV